MTNPPVSSANQWMACHGSFQAQRRHRGVPGDPPASRLEGRACHEAAQRVLNGETPESIVNTLSRDGIVITPDLIDVAMVYVNDVCSVAGNGASVECHTSLSHILLDWVGVCDAWFYDTETATLNVWDFKSGHTFVPAFENWQLVLYASGWLHYHSWNVVSKINLRIVQPRCYTSEGAIRTWSMTGEQFREVEQRVIDAIPQVIGDAPQCRTGTHCKRCTARAHCETLQRVAFEGIDYEASLETHSLSGQELGMELKILQRAQRALEYRLSGLEEQALHEIQQGGDVAFYTVKHGKGRERWRKDVPVEQVIMMGDLMGVDVRKPVELDTPAQLRKKGIDETVIKAYSETPSTGAKLVEVDVKQMFQHGDK